MKITFKNKVIELTQDAYYNNGRFQAAGIDADGNEYTVYWDILEGHEDDEWEDTMCNWDEPSMILDEYGYEV